MAGDGETASMADQRGAAKRGFWAGFPPWVALKGSTEAWVHGGALGRRDCLEQVKLSSSLCHLPSPQGPRVGASNGARGPRITRLGHLLES